MFGHRGGCFGLRRVKLISVALGESYYANKSEAKNFSLMGFFILALEKKVLLIT